MSPVEVFRASLKRCLAKTEFLLDFYGIFMASSDEIREKFKNTDLKRQTEILADSLWVMATVATSAKDSPATETESDWRETLAAGIEYLRTHH